MKYWTTPDALELHPLPFPFAKEEWQVAGRNKYRE
jgi:hypothetical protein